MRFKNQKNLLASAAGMLLLVLAFSSCKKEESQPAQISLDLPSDQTLAYGEVVDLALPNDLINQSGATLKIEFSETENVQIANGVGLYDKLAQAVVVDKEEGKIHIDSRLIYPNNEASSVTGKKLPESYKITVSATSANGTVIGNQTISVRITTAKLLVKNIDNSTSTPYAYVLYSKEAASFELEYSSIPTEGASWYLPAVKDAESVVSITGNQLHFAATAGDPKQQAESAYDLEPALQKDGFTIAATKFRVIFIPQIKFFYGTYYPEYNLTLLFNLVHIGLSNGYLSAVPTLYPEKYKSTFSLISIEKDGAAYDNSEGIIELNVETGAVRVKQNTKLTAGSYKMIIKAVTTTGLAFTTDLTLAMEAG